MGSLTYINEHGDQTIEWNPDDPTSVAKAEGAFNALQQEGYEFHEVEMAPSPGKVIKQFKKTLGKILAVSGTDSSGRSAMRGGPHTSTQ